MSGKQTMLQVSFATNQWLQLTPSCLSRTTGIGQRKFWCAHPQMRSPARGRASQCKNHASLCGATLTHRAKSDNSAQHQPRRSGERDG
jgi:hypothetical protein